MNPLISIIVPIYNVEKWLTKCLSSIKKQTYQNIEVLLIDDGSKDNSPQICERYSKTDFRFKYYKKRNGGLSDARNYGIDRANGEYLAFIDSDDYVSVNYIEVLYEQLVSSKAEVAICGFNRVNEKGYLLDSINLDVTSKKVLSGDEVITLSFDSENYGWALACAWNKLYKKELFESLRFEKNRYYEDGLIFPFLFKKVKKAVIVHKPLYFYIQRNNSIMHSSMTIKKIKDDNYSMTRWISLFKNDDNKIYIMSIRKYKDWIVSEFVNNKTIINDNNLETFLQSQYRKYTKEQWRLSKRISIKDLIAYFSLKTFSLLKRIKQNMYNDR